MKVGAAIQALYDACQYNSEESDARAVMADILRGCGWHVAENDGELREMALENTDLEEPE